jgi:hypothetical protein
VIHQAQAYIRNNLITAGSPPSSTVESYTLNLAESRRLLNYLKSDAVSYTYSSTVSMGDAISGARKELFTWTTVKLYYSTFYAFRALLALNGVCIFYIGTKPYCIEVEPGKSPVKRNGQTHKIILSEFKKQNIEPSLLSQQIDLEDPPEWLMTKREDANYKSAKFCEPNVPRHFKKIVDFGFRYALETYLLDNSSLYLFDPDHAILAYPLKTLQVLYKQIVLPENFTFENEEVSYLCQLFSDHQGPIPEMNRVLRACLRS